MEQDAELLRLLAIVAEGTPEGGEE